MTCPFCKSPVRPNQWDEPDCPCGRFEDEPDVEEED